MRKLIFLACLLCANAAQAQEPQCPQGTSFYYEGGSGAGMCQPPGGAWAVHRQYLTDPNIRAGMRMMFPNDPAPAARPTIHEPEPTVTLAPTITPYAPVTVDGAVAVQPKAVEPSLPPPPKVARKGKPAPDPDRVKPLW